MGDREMFKEIDGGGREQKEDDDLEARIKTMKIMSQRRMMEEEGTKPRKRARLAYDWRNLKVEGAERTKEEEPVRTDSEEEETEDTRAINPEKNQDDILSILEEEEEKFKNQNPEKSVVCR